MSEIVRELKNLDLKNDSEEKIKESIGKIKYCLNPAYLLPEGGSIYRSVKVTDSFFPDTKSKVSYNPNASRIGRANVVGNTVFYGSITTRRTDEDLKRMGIIADIPLKKTDPGYMINVLECSDMIVDEGAEGTELYAVGMWRILKSMEVSTIVNHFPLNDFGRKELEFLNKFYSDMESNQNTHGLNPENVELIRPLLPEYKIINEFLAEEFGKDVRSKDEFNYQISAYYANRLIYHPNSVLQGIKYPSVKANKEGYNVALHPKVVNQKYIELERSAIVRIYKKKDSKEIIWNWEGVAEYSGEEPFNYLPVKDITVSDEKMFLKLKENKMEHLFVPTSIKL